MIWKRYFAVIIFIFLPAVIFYGCEKKAEKEKKEYQTAGLSKGGEEDTEPYDMGGDGPQHRYRVYPGDHVLQFSVRLPYSGGYDDVQFRAQRSGLDALGVHVEVENVELESYFHPIWVVDAKEGFLGLQKEIFTNIKGVWVITLSDAEETGRFSEKAIKRILSGKKFHYGNIKTGRMVTSSEELYVYQVNGESYIAHLDVRVEIPDGISNVHRQEVYLKGTPAGYLELTITQPDEGGPIFIEGLNDKIPDEYR